MWSQTADRLKAGPARLRKLQLGLTVAASVLALAGSQVTALSGAAAKGLTITAAVTLGVAAVLRALSKPEQARRWTRARSVSEAIKGEVYLYLCRGGDYQSGDNDGRLAREVDRIEAEAGDLRAYTGDIEPRQRDLPAVRGVESYLNVRVRAGQLENFYKPKARQARRRLGQLKAAQVGLAIVAAVLAAFALLSANAGAWAAVATTAAAAVAAYVAGERYEYLWIEYSRTASELSRLLKRRTAPDGTKLPDPDLAAACEHVISVQNEAWMAKWGEDEPNDAAGSA